MTVFLNFLLFFLGGILMLTPVRAVTADDNRPNVIVVFADDLGYGDLGCYGAVGYSTPNLDEMAAQGMMFRNFYSGSAVCTPSRAALLTGCLPPRLGLTDVILPNARTGLNLEEVTIPEILKRRGYVSGIIGKWHMGDDERLMPMNHGFDEYYGLPYSNDMWPVHYDGEPVSRENYLKAWKLSCPPLFLYDGINRVEEIASLEDQDQLTTKYTERAVDFIHRNHEQPFFLYLAHSMPHVPLAVSEKFKGKSELGLYGDVIMEIDWSVGQIIKALIACGIDEQTLLIFTSDNGPWLNYGNHGGSAGGLREGKNSVFEGGFRVPCLMRWPGLIPPGAVCSNMASSIDILPTIAAISGAELPENDIDGVSILPLLKGNFGENPRREFYFYTGRSLNAVRLDNWKLVFPHAYNSNIGSIFGNDGWPGVFKPLHTQGALYNMYRDSGERYDKSHLYPEIVQQLTRLADRMREQLGDALSGTEGTECRPPGTAAR